MNQIALLGSILIGAALGFQFPQVAISLEPIGEIFLNLLLMAVLPLIFFGIAAAVARMHSRQESRNLFLSMGLVYGAVSLLVALLTGLVVLWCFQSDLKVDKAAGFVYGGQLEWSLLAKNLFAVSSWAELFASKNILALIVLSILVGFAARADRRWQEWFGAAESLFMRLFEQIMKVAPIGFLAFFGALVGKLGSEAISKYLQIWVIYHVWGGLWALLLFGLGFWLVGKQFLKALVLPATTSLATCSSIASIPANLKAAEALGVPNAFFK